MIIRVYLCSFVLKKKLCVFASLRSEKNFDNSWVIHDNSC